MIDFNEPLRSPALRSQEAADNLRVSLCTLNHLFERGELQRIRLSGVVLVMVSDLNDLLRRKREEAVTTA
jgi:ABC-type cobalamin transport system ATPase subunit